MMRGARASASTMAVVASMELLASVQRTGDRSSADSPQIARPQDVHVMSYMAGADVRQCTNGDRVAARNAATIPRDGWQPIEERDGRGPNGRELVQVAVP